MNIRRTSIVCACAAVLILASVFWLTPLYRSSQAAPATAPKTDGNFKGKFLLVRVQWDSRALEEAQIRKIGDRSWLVGKGLGGSERLDAEKGKTI
jgi:hypothetical protein